MTYDNADGHSASLGKYVLIFTGWSLACSVLIAAASYFLNFKMPSSAGIPHRARMFRA
jgi:hypothetical protein